MEKKLRNFEENYAELIKFCERENRLPQIRFGKEESRLRNFIQKHRNDIRIIETIEKHSKKGKSFDENLQDLIEFCERENRLPHEKYGKEDDSRLMGFIQRYKKDLRIIELKEKYSRNKSFDESLQDLVEFCERENRLPQTRFGEEEGRLRGFIKYYRKDPRIVEIVEYYRKGFGGGKKSRFSENLQDLIEFCERENRLPSSKFNKKEEESRLCSFIYAYKDDIRIIEIVEKYSRKGRSFDENLQDLIEFCERENKLPHEGYGKEGARLKVFINRHKDDVRIIAIKKKYSKYSKRGA